MFREVEQWNIVAPNEFLWFLGSPDHSSQSMPICQFSYWWLWRGKYFIDIICLKFVAYVIEGYGATSNFSVSQCCRLNPHLSSYLCFFLDLLMQMATGSTSSQFLPSAFCTDRVLVVLNKSINQTACHHQLIKSNVWTIKEVHCSQVSQ